MRGRLFQAATALGLTAGLACQAQAQAFTENFDDIATLAGNGWLLQNNSSPVGSLGWFQGTATSATPTVHSIRITAQTMPTSPPITTAPAALAPSAIG